MGSLGDDEGVSRFVNKKKTIKRFLKGFKKVLSPSHLNSVVSQRLTSGVTFLSGEQQAFDVTSYFNSAGATEIFHMGRLLGQDLLALQDAMEATAANQGSAGNATALTRKILIEKVFTTYTFKNTTNVPLRMVLYDCVCRRDGTSTQTPLAAWQLGDTHEGVTYPVGTTNANTQNVRFPGSTPFQSEQFCQYYKVRKVTKFELHPGSIHRHTMYTKPGGLMSAEYINNFQEYKGLSSSLLAVVTGGVVDDTVSFVGTSNVTYSAFAVDVVVETRAVVKSMERSRTALQQFNGLNTALPLASQFVTLEDTDATGVPVATS